MNSHPLTVISLSSLIRTFLIPLGHHPNVPNLDESFATLQYISGSCLFMPDSKRLFLPFPKVIIGTMDFTCDLMLRFHLTLRDSAETGKYFVKKNVLKKAKIKLVFSLLYILLKGAVEHGGANQITLKHPRVVIL